MTVAKVAASLLLALLSATAAAQSNASLTIKWKDQPVSNDDVVMARVTDGNVHAVNGRTDEHGKVTFKNLSAGDWKVLTGPCARLQPRLDHLRIDNLAGITGGRLALKDGDNAFEVDTGANGYSQVELKISWPDPVESGRVTLRPHTRGSCFYILEDTPLYIAWPGPHVLDFNVSFKPGATAFDQPSDMSFAQAVSVPEGPSCVIEPAVRFSRLKLTWKLPAEAKQALVESYLAGTHLSDGPTRTTDEMLFVGKGTEKDCGLIPCGQYSMHAITAHGEKRWEVRRDAELSKSEETIEIDFKAATGNLNVTIEVEGKDWDKADLQFITLRLVQSGKAGNTVTTRGGLDQAIVQGLAPGKWTLEIVGNGYLPSKDTFEIKGNSTTNLQVKVKHAAGVLVTVTGMTWVPHRWEFENKEGKQLLPETPDGTSGKSSVLGDGGLLIYAIPRGTATIRFKIEGKKDIVLKVSDAPGDLQTAKLHIPED